MKNKKVLLSLVLSAVLLTGGCLAGSENPQADTPMAPTSADQPTEIVEQEQELPATVEGEAESTEAIMDLPTPRPALDSTDPGAVNLASGGLQLVELFAYW